MQAISTPLPGRVTKPVTPIVRDKKEDSVTNVRIEATPDPLEEASTTDRGQTPDEGETSVQTLIGSLDDVEDTVTDLPFPGTG